jgi:PAT family acetyl-CoA transporter-like MFS transporter 1
MVAGASRVNAWVGSDGGPPCMVALTVYFTLLYLMMATQDIAVDGWALSMLSRENVGYASTCNSIGQTVGYFVAHVGFLALQDADVCNKYLRAEPQSMGMVTLASFMFFWGIIFIGTTLFVWAFKKEEHDESEEEV